VASGAHAQPGFRADAPPALAAGSAPLISPWFLKIEAELLHGWWDALDCVQSDELIHR
jgi:hypothetical protein